MLSVFISHTYAPTFVLCAVCMCVWVDIAKKWDDGYYAGMFVSSWDEEQYERTGILFHEKAAVNYFSRCCF